MENGATAEVICRELGISRSTLYQWRSKYGGMEVSQVRRLRELEEENRKLTNISAESSHASHLIFTGIKKNNITSKFGNSIANARNKVIFR